MEEIKQIQEQVRDYLAKHNIKALIIGISGGFDSTMNAAILRPVCDELNIPLIGAYIFIESNKQEETDRAILTGKTFCTEFINIDLTEEYKVLNAAMNPEDHCESKQSLSYAQKVKHGNIKARMRMIYLYNLAAKYKGIVVDNDNKTEHMLGFWTIGGDIGDITPLASFFKTELYELAKEYIHVIDNKDGKKALQAAIDAVPTDGLGITSSDVEQFGVDSYAEVDEILRKIEKNPTEECPHEEGSGESKVWWRWKNSHFKRHHPHRIFI